MTLDIVNTNESKQNNRTHKDICRHNVDQCSTWGRRTGSSGLGASLDEVSILEILL